METDPMNVPSVVFIGSNQETRSIFSLCPKADLYRSALLRVRVLSYAIQSNDLLELECEGFQKPLCFLHRQ